MEKRGYILPKNYVPKIPKNVTQKSIDYLKKKNEQRYQKATDKTGKKGSGLKKRKRERSEASKKGAQTRKKKQNDKADIALLNLRNHIDSYSDRNPRAVDELQRTLDMVLDDDINEHYAVLDNIEKHEKELESAVDAVMQYDMDEQPRQYNRAYTNFFTLLKPKMSAKEFRDFQDLLDEY